MPNQTRQYEADDAGSHGEARKSWFTSDQFIWVLVIAVAIGILGIFSLQRGGGFTEPVESGFPWHTDYRAAMVLAAEQNRPMLLNFTADWCAPCQVMNGTVYNQDWVVQAINERVIPIKIDVTTVGPDEQRLISQYQARGWPTQIILGPDGRELGRKTGVTRAEAFVAWIDATVNGSPAR